MNRPYMTPKQMMDEIGARTLAVRPDGDKWTVIDRDTGELIGSFGIKVQVDTRQEAIDEAWRFGSKWGWTVDEDHTPEDDT